MPAPALPAFGVDDYAALLARLQPVSAMPARAAGTAYLRHDVDFLPGRVEAMARAEAEEGARATCYVSLTQPYNPR